MAWRPHGRASVDPTNPKAFGVCDRCGFLYNHVNLRFQYDWRGNELFNTRLLVCDRCYDKPFELNRPIKLPPDPVPIRDARPEQYFVDEAGSGGITQSITAEFWDAIGFYWDDGVSTWDATT